VKTHLFPLNSDVLDGIVTIDGRQALYL